MAVATVESVSRTPILLNMAVAPANRAESSAIITHIGISPSFRRARQGATPLPSNFVTIFITKGSAL